MLDFFMDNFYTSNDLLDSSLKDLEFSVLDFETTGLYPYNGDKIVEVGIVRCNTESILSTYESMINPAIPIPAEVTKINHITNDMVKDSPLIADKLTEITDFMNNSVIVAHNLSFDLSFLNYELEKNGKLKVDNWMADTIKIAKSLHPEYESYKLEYITEQLGIENKDAHRALADAEATAIVLQALMKETPQQILKDLLPFKIQ